MPLRAQLAITSFLIAAISGCATPIAPSGGPPDEIPPEILETTPPGGAVNVDTESIRITFSEYVEESSLPQAFSISPGFDQPLEYSWSRRSVVVQFPQPLRENTTYVLTIDTNLRDAHGVALRSPIVMAFSTGPTISSGVLSGRVAGWRSGDPVAGVDVLAYAVPDSVAPDSLPARPAYRTQTDTEGAFNFDFLTEQYYYVAVLEDENRNLQPDPLEAFAPPPYPALFADSTAEPPETPWVLARIDTTAPAPLRAESLSRSRHVLRFTEPVRFADRDPSTWTLADSTTGEPIEIRELYLQIADPRQVFFTTDNLGDGRYEVYPAAIIDSSGNAVLASRSYFSPADRSDTLQTRFLEFLPDGSAAEEAITLPQNVEPGVRFNTPIDAALLGEAVSVLDSVGAPQSYIGVTENGTDYDILTEPRLQPGFLISIAVDASEFAGPDSVLTQAFQRISSDNTGEISGVIEFNGTDRSPIRVHAIPIADTLGNVPTYETTAGAGGSFDFQGLPAGSYRLRAYADENSNGVWDPGLLMPYTPGEHIIWPAEPVRVRARWETALPDTLQISTARR